MARIDFDSLGAGSRLWSFNSDRALTSDEVTRARKRLDEFFADWTAHRRELVVGYEMRYNRFVLVGVDETARSPSGCSIDSMMDVMGDLGRDLGVEFVDAPDVVYRDGNTIHAVTREQFAQLAESGQVDSSTIVFDRTVPTLGDLREGKWELPAGDSWHARAFTLVNTDS